jgi:hypothetical protein
LFENQSNKSSGFWTLEKVEGEPSPWCLGYHLLLSTIMPLPSYLSGGPIMPKPTILFVTDEFQQVLDNLPSDEPRSKLEPFRRSILRWNREGRTYRSMQKILRENCGVRASLSTLFHFVHTRSRPRQREAGTAALEPLVTAAPVVAAPASYTPTSSTPSTDPYAEARERMRQLKEAPAPRKPEKRFHYTEQDSIDPLVLIPKTTEEK